MAPSFLPFFDPSKIEHTTAFLLRSMAHTMLGTVYYCTCARYSSLCTLTLTLIISCLYWTVQLPGATLASGGRLAYRYRLYWCFVHLYTVHTNPGLSRQRILTNESTSRITCMNRVVQSQLLTFIGADRQKTDRCDPGSHMEAAHCLKINKEYKLARGSTRNRI